MLLFVDLVPFPSPGLLGTVDTEDSVGKTDALDFNFLNSFSKSIDRVLS